MRPVLKALGLTACTIVCLLTLFKLDSHVLALPTGEAAGGVVVSPLFESRLEEMQAQFRGAEPAPQSQVQSVGEQQALLFPSGVFSACAASGCIGSACAGSACGASGCAGSGCAGSACAGSGCGASACIGSACGGSACTGSACGGSACAGSACAGSACGGSGCVGSACGGSACLGSSCGGSGCVGSVCGVSGCAGSGCGFSGCVGSACTQSGCVGSACGQSGCVGSVCAHCSGQAPGDGVAVAGFYGNAGVVPVSCPFGSTSEFNPVFITGFNVEKLVDQDRVRITWISTGADVREFHLLRRGPDGTPRRIAEGPARSYQLSHLVVEDMRGADLFLEIVDRTGWTTRVGSDGTTERIAANDSAGGKARAEGRAGGESLL